MGNNIKYEYNNLKIICIDDCGNAPKKYFLKEFNIAFAKNDMVFIIDNITDNFQWNIIGKKLIKGKENFVEILKKCITVKLLNCTLTVLLPTAMMVL